MKPKPSRERMCLVGILVVAAFLRFWNLWRFGLHHDAALNSTRALGWFDYLVGEGQTAPIVWFNHIPWWANLSFHDHPFLSFAIQKIFFVFFGGSSLVALLPFVLAGVIATWVIYKLVKEYGSELSGRSAAAVFALSSYAVWAARAGYLEGLLVLWIALSVYFFVRVVEADRTRDLYLWSIFTACALLTKYTAIFLLPAAGLYLLFGKRRVFLNKHFWLAVLVFFVLLTPVIIYNAEVYAARGHFDAALSSMVGLNPADYASLSYRSASGGIALNFENIFVSVARNSSVPFVIMFSIALLYFAWQAIRKRLRVLSTVAGLNLGMLTLMFLFAGAADRFVVIILPFLAIFAGLAVGEWSKQIKGRTVAALVGIAVVCEFLFAFNTNVLANPLSKAPLAYSAQRFNVDGFESLNAYLRKFAYGALGPLHRLNTLTGQAAMLDIKGREVVLFDERADWFSRVWYVDRYVHYYGTPIVYFTDLDKVVGSGSGAKTDFLEYLRKGGATGFWFVLAQGPAISAGADPDYSRFMEDLESQLNASGTLTKSIKDGSGETVFKIYHVK
ncbi:MAG: glycosyltransferase family 39 protein [Patescibacteria group bacterium]|nr:glycosyltransferase family 39 protein [Patescibacteria group bacterium]